MGLIAVVGGELYRLALLRRLEEALDRSGRGPVAGVDEAGRGCLAGPVVAAAVIPGDGPPLPGVDDSKRLEAGARAELAARIRATARACVFAAVPASAIDSTDILRATRLAMLKAVAALDPRPGFLIVDAVPLRESGLRFHALVKGDALSYAVACASIVAKFERDRMMIELHQRYPHYGFDHHKGYAVPEHRTALERHGPSPEHRLSFASVVPRVAPRGERPEVAA
jgi:ribonuclease HII